MSTNGNGHSNGNGTSSKWWHGLWRGSRNGSHDLAAYRRLALQLHYDLPRETSLRSVLLLTPSAGEPCAAGALGLARSLGEELRRPVLLIDTSSARPNITELLGQQNAPGWRDLQQNPSQSIQSTAIPTTSDHVWFLPVGSKDTVMAAPEETQKRLLQAQQHYDFVVLSGGSVLGDSGVLGLLPYVGSTLLLVMENETRTDDLNAAEEALSLCKARNVRLVLASPFRGEVPLLSARPAGSATGR